MNSKDKAFLDKFCIKKSRNLITIKNFGATDFSIIGGLGWYSLRQLKNDQISTHQSNPHPAPTHHPTKSLHLLIKALLPLLLLVGTLKFKSLKRIFLEKKFLPVYIFTRTYNSCYDHESLLQTGNF